MIEHLLGGGSPGDGWGWGMDGGWGMDEALVGSRMDEPLMAGPHSPQGREERDPLLLGMERPRCAQSK